MENKIVFFSNYKYSDDFLVFGSARDTLKSTRENIKKKSRESVKTPGGLVFSQTKHV